MREIPPREAMTDPHAIIARMGGDIRSVPRVFHERRWLLQFGWTPVQIDSWFESACVAAEQEFAHA